MDSFGTRLVRARRARRITQSALAREAEIPGDSMISRYERDEVEPRTETIGRLADALQVPFEWLALGRGDAKLDDEPAVEECA